MPLRYSDELEERQALMAVRLVLIDDREAHPLDPPVVDVVPGVGVIEEQAVVRTELL